MQRVTRSLTTHGSMPLSAAGRMGRDLSAVLAEAGWSAEDDASEADLLLDLADVRLMTSEDIGQLIALRLRLDARGRRLVLCNVTADVYELMCITRLDHVIEVRVAEEVSLASRRTAPPSVAVKESSVRESSARTQASSQINRSFLARAQAMAHRLVADHLPRPGVSRSSRGMKNATARSILRG